jgi:hypothetical protein
MARYRTVKQLSPTDAAYIAGLIDGEGTVTLSRKHRDENRQLVVSITPVPVCCWGILQKTRTSPVRASASFAPHSTRSWPFLAPTSDPETGPKTAKATHECFNR